MRIITAIETQKRNPDRVNIHLDGSFAFGVARITAAWLKVGQEITDDKITLLQADDARETTYQKALHFLSYRPRSEMEICRHLKKIGCEENIIAETVTRLQENNLINDQEFAKTWVENRTAFRPRSRSALRMELRQKGLSDDIVQTALDELLDDSSLALEAARIQAHRYLSLEWQDFYRKMGGYLARRGFSYATLAPVVKQVWSERKIKEFEKNQNLEG